MTEKKAETGGGRSVSYPFITLEHAIVRSKQLWDKEGKNLAFMTAAVKHWGYAEKSSGGKQTVAALKGFGLILDTGNGDGRQLRLSERALDILLEPETSLKRISAIRDAVMQPKIYAELLTKWSASQLPSDETMTAYLLRDKDFNRNTVADFVKDFRENVIFARLADLSNESVSENANESKDIIPIGSSVQWEANGVLNLQAPRRLTGYSSDGKFGFVEGSFTGIPVSELVPAAGDSSSQEEEHPRQYQQEFALNEMKQDTFSLDEGQASLRWPANLSVASFEDFESWVQLLLRKIKRSVRDPA